MVSSLNLSIAAPISGLQDPSLPLGNWREGEGGREEGKKVKRRGSREGGREGEGGRVHDTWYIITRD